MLTNYLVNKVLRIRSRVNVQFSEITMTKKRIRIDVEDSDGTKFDIKLEGNVTRDKVLKIWVFCFGDSSASVSNRAWAIIAR